LDFLGELDFLLDVAGVLFAVISAELLLVEFFVDGIGCLQLAP
jgi:hypothetical protein